MISTVFVWIIGETNSKARKPRNSWSIRIKGNTNDDFETLWVNYEIVKRVTRGSRQSPSQGSSKNPEWQTNINISKQEWAKINMKVIMLSKKLTFKSQTRLQNRNVKSCSIVLMIWTLLNKFHGTKKDSALWSHKFQNFPPAWLWQDNT